MNVSGRRGVCRFDGDGLNSIKQKLSSKNLIICCFFHRKLKVLKFCCDVELSKTGMDIFFDLR